MLIVIISIILFGSYAGLRFASLPVLAYTCQHQSANPGLTLRDPYSLITDSNCVQSAQELSITVSFPIYVIALASWVGWWLLILFLGSGLSALPVDLINQFRFRPVPMQKDQFMREKSEMASKVEKLIGIGKKLLEDRQIADKQSGCKHISHVTFLVRCRLECASESPASAE